jgi:hypothetical protein
VRITLLVLLSTAVWAVPGLAQTPLSGPAASVLFNAAQRGPPRFMLMRESADTVRPQIRPT